MECSRKGHSNCCKKEINKTNKVCVGDLCGGKYFITDNGDLYLKATGVINELNRCLAVRIRDGKITIFENSDLVIERSSGNFCV